MKMKKKTLHPEVETYRDVCKVAEHVEGCHYKTKEEMDKSLLLNHTISKAIIEMTRMRKEGAMELYETDVTGVSHTYRHPDDVLEDSRLTVEQKEKVLSDWLYHLQQLDVAEEENMRPDVDKAAGIRRVSQALENLHGH